MKIVIMHQTVTIHDAIGNDIERMYDLLGQQYECYVFADNRFNDKVSYVEYDELVKIAAQPENLMIYHHSVFWEAGEKLLLQARAKIVIRYHNITLPEFFAPYNDFHAQQCLLGRKQTQRLCANLPGAYWLCASQYNSQDVLSVSAERIKICPPFHKIEEWSAENPDEEIMKKLMYSQAINLLFVGRVAPNKGHLLLLEILKVFRSNYEDDVHLWIIGKFDDGLLGYNDKITQLINSYNLHANVHFIGEINDSIMSAYYLGCDFFVCTSEHEGFCVPLEEAQYFQLPIIARRSSAIPETLGPNQLVLQENVLEYAAAIHLIYHNREQLRWLRQKGLQNYEKRFTYETIKQKFMSSLVAWQLL